MLVFAILTGGSANTSAAADPEPPSNVNPVDVAAGMPVDCVRTSESGTTTVSGASRLVDGDDGTAVTFTGEFDGWSVPYPTLTCTVDLGSLQQITEVRQYTGSYGVQGPGLGHLAFQCEGSGLRTGKLEGSEDGTTWIDLSDQSNQPETDVAVDKPLQFLRTTASACEGEVGIYTLSAYAGASSQDIAAQVDRSGAAVRALGEEEYPDVYAGVSVDETLGVVKLSVTQIGADSAALVQAAGNVPVAISVVSRSWSALTTLMQQVLLDDDSYWSGQGVSVNEVGPEISTDTVDVGVEPYSSDIAASIEQKYGAANVTVYQSSGTDESTASRTNDSSPWNGGDEVAGQWANGTWHLCTAGFGLHRIGSNTSTGPAFALAGHCFPDGTAVYPYVNGQRSSTRMGVVSRSSSIYTSGGDDLEIITSSSSSRIIWETNTGRAYGDSSEQMPATGTTLCHSGVATNKRCGTLKDVNFCTKTNGVKYCHQDLVKSSSLLQAGGDSGGPWFVAYTSNSTRYFSAVGIHHGYPDGTQYTCNTQLGSEDTCSDQAVYTEIGRYSKDYSPDFWPNY